MSAITTEGGPQVSAADSDGGTLGPGLPAVAAGTAVLLLAGAVTVVAVLRRRRVTERAGGPASAWTFQ